MLARLLLIAVFVAACGGPSPTATLPGPSHGLEPSPGCGFVPPSPPADGPSPGCATAPPNETPAPTAPPALELPDPVAALDPGTYTKSSFTPTVTFTIGDGWTAAQATAGFFDIQDEPGSLDVVAVQFGNVTEADTAAEAAANVAARSDLVVSEPDDVKVDGVPGIRLVIETTDPLDKTPPIFHTVITLTPGAVSIASARRLELTLLDVDGSVLAIMVGGSIAEWDRALEMATPVVESVTIVD